MFHLRIEVHEEHNRMLPVGETQFVSTKTAHVRLTASTTRHTVLNRSFNSDLKPADDDDEEMVKRIEKTGQKIYRERAVERGTEVENNDAWNDGCMVQ